MDGHDALVLPNRYLDLTNLYRPHLGMLNLDLMRATCIGRISNGGGAGSHFVEDSRYVISTFTKEASTMSSFA
jgi:hypothetical protein